jgi:hypothetical protein
MIRRRRFKVAEPRAFNGASAATVIIEMGPTPLISVRPFRRRKLYTLPLADVAGLIIFRVAQAEARERRPARKGRR